MSSFADLRGKVEKYSLIFVFLKSLFFKIAVILYLEEFTSEASGLGVFNNQFLIICFL